MCANVDLRVTRSISCVMLSVIVSCSMLMTGCRKADTPPATTASVDSLTVDSLGETPNVHRFGKALLAGQPSEEDLALAKEQGIVRVITLREDGEINWDEAAAANRLGLEYLQLSFHDPETLTDELLDTSIQYLAESEEHPVLMHCGGASRVGAVWLAYRAIVDGLSVEEATAEAEEVGLRNEAVKQRVIQYVQERATQPAAE